MNLAAQADSGIASASGSEEQRGDDLPKPQCRFELDLIDAATNQTIPGLIRVLDENGRVIPIEGLLNRGMGLRRDHPTSEWYALIEPATLRLPQKRLTLEAISGLDSELGSLEVDLSGRDRAAGRIALNRLDLLAGGSWFSGNTHLHLKNVSREESDRYLRVVPQADRTDLVFVSHLLRTSEDKTYITNEYRKADLVELASPASAFGFGEEHRHNFEAFGMGYGHVMFLDIEQLIEPVSIGRGIMDVGPDYPNLKKGIDEAHRQNATVIWCHNDMGHEDIPNWVTGSIHAQNTFDGGRRSSYEDSFYRYLNIGRKVPFSTGTDWFIFDFSRVYAQLDQPFSEDAWLEALKQGRSFITNGPLLKLKVEGRGPGDTLNLSESGFLSLRAMAQGRTNFGSIEVVVNGSVVRASRSRKVENHYEANLTLSLFVDQPSWVALRIPKITATNELGGELFAHTSPVYINLKGERRFSTFVAQSLVEEMQESLSVISERGLFETEKQRLEVLDYYHQAIQTLGEEIASHASSQ